MDIEIFKNIPLEMRVKKQWVLWRLELKPTKDDPDHKTKVPYQVNGKCASSKNKETWNSFEDVLNAYVAAPSENYIAEHFKYSGIGFVFNNDFVGIDIDHCIVDDILSDIAKKWIETFGSYAERSQSGTGLHIICKGKIPDSKGHNPGSGYEMYTEGRFFVCTGDALMSEDVQIVENQAAIDDFFSKHIKADKPQIDKPQIQATSNFTITTSLTDDQVLELLRRAKNSTEFESLFAGCKSHKSQSEDDLALCSLIAFYTQDASQIDRIFRSSGLYRAKWDKRHGHDTYGNLTIQKAIDGLTSRYVPTVPQCKYCGQSIQFTENKPFNLDGTSHLCRKEPKHLEQETEPQKEKIRIEQIKLGEKAENVASAICRDGNVFNVILSGTGTGKTELIASKLLNHLEKEESVTVQTDTNKNARDLYNKVSEKTNSQNLKLINRETQEKEKEKATVGTANITTHAYTGLYGNYPHTFPLAGGDYQNEFGDNTRIKGLLTVEHLYLDEVHSMINHCRVDYPLCQAYVKIPSDKTHYWRHTESYQSWQENRFHFWPLRKEFGKFEYPGDIHDESPNTWDNKKRILDSSVAEMQEPDKYEQILGTLFAFPLTEKFSPSIPTPTQYNDKKQKNYCENDYVSTIYRTMIKPRIVCEFPILRETEEPLSKKALKEMLEKALEKVKEKASAKGKKLDDEKIMEMAQSEMRKLVIYPDKAAWIPRLQGYSLLPLIQCMSYNKSVNAFSAGLTDTQREILEQAANAVGKQVRYVNVEKIPFVFDMVILKKKEKIASPDIAKILAKGDKLSFPPSLVIAWKKTSAKSTYTDVRSKIPGKACLWDKDDFTGDIEKHEDEIEKQIVKNIVTYSGASLLQGGNLPYHQIGIFNFAQWVAAAALDLPIGASKQDKLVKLAKIINGMIQQELGRLLRVLQREWDKRKEQDALGNDSPIVSDKKIVILFHNVGSEFFEFMPDKDLAHTIQTYSDSDEKSSWYSVLPETQIKSYVDAIHAGLSGNSPQNWKDADAKKLQSEGKKRLNKITQQKRDIFEFVLKEDREKEKREKLLQKLIEKGRQLVSQGKSKRDICISMNLARYKDLQNEIYQNLYPNG